MAEPPRAAPPFPVDPAADTLAERRLSTETAYRGEFFDVARDLVVCADGHQGVREWIHHPGAVMVVALRDAEHVVLERQFRYAPGRSFIEMPAGKLEPGEDPLDCGRRELQEETGFRARHWERLGSFHNAIGYCDERIEVYLAHGLEFVGAAAEAGEVLEVFSMPWRDLLQWVDDGRVTDVKTIIGVHWLERRLARGPL